jgi:hypothetical protein
MWRRENLERTDVSEERIASSSMKEEYESQKSVRRLLAETSVLTRSTRRHILEDGVIHSPSRENLKSCMEIGSDVILIEMTTECVCDHK